MISPFGIDHGDITKRDYTQAQQRWQKTADRSNVAETIGQAGAGTTGVLLAGSTLRDAAFREHPDWEPKVARQAARMPLRIAAAITHGKPGLKTLTLGAAGTATAAVAGHSRKLAERKVRRYELMSKADEPGSAMHARDLEIVAKRFGVEPNEDSLQRSRKVQGALGGTAAVTGLAALATKGGAKLLPKLTRGGTEGAKYQKHLDQAANALLFTGAGLGGASGLHQSAIYSAEAKQKKTPVIKRAYDPEGRRVKREKAYEAGLAGGSAVAAGSAARTLVQRNKGYKAQAHFNQRADYYRAKAGRQQQERTTFFNQRSDFYAGRGEARHRAAGAMANEAADLSARSNPGPERKRPNYRRRAVAEQMRQRAVAAHFDAERYDRVADRLRDLGTSGAHTKASGASARTADRLRFMANNTRIPKRPTKALVAAGALAAGAAAVHHHRQHGGTPYTSWMDGRTAAPKAPKGPGPLGRYRIKRRYQALSTPEVHAPAFLTAEEQNQQAVAAQRRQYRS